MFYNQLPNLIVNKNDKYLRFLTQVFQNQDKFELYQQSFSDAETVL